MAGLGVERRGELAAAVRHFERVEELYRDDYLLYEGWTLMRREELEVAPSEQTIELSQGICAVTGVAGPSVAWRTVASPALSPRSEPRQAPP